MVEGEETNNEKLIRGHIDFHFKKLFGQLVVHRLNMVPDFLLEKFDLSKQVFNFQRKKSKRLFGGLTRINH